MDEKMKKKCELLASKMRKNSLQMAFACGNNGSHLGGGLSAIEIFATLYGAIINIDPQKPNWEERDRVIVSKGHCVLAYYSALFEVGFLNKEQIDSFEINESGLHGHATRNMALGIDFSGGSLGLGLSYGVGVALAGKMKKKPYRVFVILGDGECQEGSIWEAAMSASHFKLDNLVIIIDKNNLQYDGHPKEVMDLGDMRYKLESFGFMVSLVDGHNVAELYDAMERFKYDFPHAIIAETVKGKGVSFMENNKDWHHSRLTKEQYDLAMLDQAQK